MRVDTEDSDNFNNNEVIRGDEDLIKFKIEDLRVFSSDSMSFVLKRIVNFLFEVVHSYFVDDMNVERSFNYHSTVHLS